jgi:hypothetical protein
MLAWISALAKSNSQNRMRLQEAMEITALQM